MVITRETWLAGATARLTAAGCEDAAFDARCLLEDLGGLGHGQRADKTPLTETQTASLGRALDERQTGRPLQYILGNWDFLDMTLAVGEGVLIPRPDTETLCETVAAALAGQKEPRVLDLCAGTGCVGLGIAGLCPVARVTAVELSDDALPYLRENIARYPARRAEARQADVLTDAVRFEGGWDAIVSNPPYIPTGELPTLQREVRHEPVMALDGDADGLRFYRVIATEWSRKLRDGGILAVEVGYGQADAVTALFAAAGLRECRTARDAAGVERVVIGRFFAEK